MKYSHLIIFCLALCACSNDTVKNTLGLERAAPDEFRVVSRPPLSVPPQFDLVPPSANAAPSNQPPASQQAQSVLMGGAKPGASTAQPAAHPVNISNEPMGGTGAETAFLKRAGTDTADPTVRDKIVEDRIAVQEQQDDRSWWNFWSSPPAKKDPLVNAPQESQRIQQDADAGKPVTTGDTPTVKDRDTGLLGRIFGY